MLSEALALDLCISVPAFRRQTSDLVTETLILGNLGIGPMNHFPYGSKRMRVDFYTPGGGRFTFYEGT